LKAKLEEVVCEKHGESFVVWERHKSLSTVVRSLVHIVSLNLLEMFALNPGGGSGGKGGAPSQVGQNTKFFGYLGLYFAVIRGAFLFFSRGDRNKALTE
jgi:hypothetical protein